MKETIAVITALMMAGCGKQPQQPGTIDHKTVAEEIRAMSQGDIDACSRIPATIHDPALDAAEDKPKEHLRAMGMAVGQVGWIVDLTKNDDGKLYVSQYSTISNSRGGEGGIYAIHVRRVKDGFEVDCNSPLRIELNHNGPRDYQTVTDVQYLIPVVGMMETKQ